MNIKKDFCKKLNRVNFLMRKNIIKPEKFIEITEKYRKLGRLRELFLGDVAELVILHYPFFVKPESFSFKKETRKIGKKLMKELSRAFDILLLVENIELITGKEVDTLYS